MTSFHYKKMSTAKHRKVELEPETLDWDFSNLSKKFEVNIGDYKRWIQLLESHNVHHSNHNIPLHFETTSTTSSRTLYVRFYRAGNGIHESMCIPAFNAFKIWIPENDTSCWFDIELFAKKSETKELIQIHSSKDNFVSAQNPCKVNLMVNMQRGMGLIGLGPGYDIPYYTIEVSNSNLIDQQSFHHYDSTKKSFKFEQLINGNELSLIFQITVLHPTLELNMPRFKDADSLKHMCIKIAERNITPSNSVRTYLISNILNIEKMKDIATQCIKENLTAVMSSKAYLDANRENPKEMCNLFSSIFGSKK